MIGIAQAVSLRMQTDSLRNFTPHPLILCLVKLSS
ncbi:MAG: hypothetical protein QOJ64_1755 [Acidobacteriota bacterium]|nr:hypothetical protein [Acidobacteriota bacterium]